MIELIEGRPQYLCASASTYPAFPRYGLLVAIAVFMVGLCVLAIAIL